MYLSYQNLLFTLQCTNNYHNNAGGKMERHMMKYDQ